MITQPTVGKLLTVHDPEKESLILLFVDEVPDSDSSVSWPYTEIAHMDEFDEGKGVQVYTGIEAGMIPSDKITREATDEDITKIVGTKLQLEGDNGISNLANWMNGINTEQDCSQLLVEEKERIYRIIEKVILENKGERELARYKSLLGLPYKSDN